MSRYIMDASTYKRIKAFDFTEMNDWLDRFYMSAYEAGAKSVKGMTTDELLSKLKDTKGIGKSTLNKVQSQFNNL